MSTEVEEGDRLRGEEDDDDQRFDDEIEIPIENAIEK